MTPEPTFPMSSSTYTRSSFGSTISSRRHKSSHHRAKTAKNKKKKLWLHFSPWKAESSDDEEADLFYFCRSRGITKPQQVTPPPARAATSGHQTANHSYSTTSNGTRQRRQQATNAASASQQQLSLTSKSKQQEQAALSSSAKSDTQGADEDRYQHVTSLCCSSLKDRRKFVRESHGDRDNQEVGTTAVKAVEVAITEEGKSSAQSAPPRKVKSPTIAESQKQLADRNAKTSPPNLTDESASQISSSSSGQRLLPKLSLNSKGQRGSHQQHSDAASVSSTLASSGDSHRPPKKVAREWSADVETEIMRLYENNGPGSGLSAFDQRAQSKTLSKVKEQVDSKVNGSNNTPSYVLALANLFRRRMQIRKEFGQVSSESGDHSFKSNPSGVYSITNAFPHHSSKIYARPLTQQSNGEDVPTPVALRYHHVASISEAVNASVPSKKTRPAPVTFCSFATPLVSANDITSGGDLLSLKIPRPGSEQDLALATGGETKQIVQNSKAEPANGNSVLAASTTSSDDVLETLLTVFPKPPQLKFFTGVPSMMENGGVAEKTEAKRDALERSLKHLSAENLANSLAASLAANSKRSQKFILPEQNLNQHQAQVEFKQGPLPLKGHVRRQPTTQSQRSRFESRRKCRSAEFLAAVGLLDETITNQHPSGFANASETTQTKRVRDAIMFEKQQGGDSNEMLEPLPNSRPSKVRWSASVGTLYPKPKILGDTLRYAAQADAISPRLMVDGLMSLCDVTLSRTGNAKMKINAAECQAKSELMTVSPIEKLKSTVAS